MEKRFTGDRVKILREHLNKAIAPFGEKHGMDIHFGDAKFDPICCTFQVKITFLPDEDFDPARTLWEVHCGRIGMDPEDLGKEFALYGQIYRLTGYNPNEKKNCLVITRLQDKKRFSAPPEQVYNAIYGPKDSLQILQESMLRTKHSWEDNCQKFGMKASDFGRTISLNGNLVVICGYDSSAKRKPICVRDLNTKEDLWVSIKSVKAALTQYKD